MKVFRIKKNDPQLIHDNAIVCLKLLKELDGHKISQRTWDSLCDAINGLANLACDLYSEMYPDEEIEDENLC